MKADVKDMLSSIYGLVTDFRNSLYDYDLLDSVKISTPVLSVGNLSMGGTGKTPVVEKILSLALEKNLQTAVISRNYLARSRGVHRVLTSRKDGAYFYGDEPFQLAQKFESAAVWTGPRKYLTAQEALKFSPYDLLVIDDGFQHRALHRDFDLVLLDSSAPSSEDFIVPKGRFRESFKALQRVQAVALTKVNWSTPERVQQLKARIPQGVEVYEIEFKMDFKKPVEKGSRVLAVSGIAKPEVFRKNLHSIADGHFEVHEYLTFPDHYAYSDKDVLRLVQKLRQFDGQQILTTEKDFVKLSLYPDLADLLNPVSVEIEFREEPKGLYAFLDKCRRL